MNKTFKVIFNRARGTLMVANEITRSVQKKSTKTVLATAVALALTSTAALADSTESATWNNDSLVPSGTYTITSSSASNGIKVTGDAKGETGSITVNVSQQESVSQSVFGILSDRAYVTPDSSQGQTVTSVNPHFAGDSLTVTVNTNSTEGANTFATTAYLLATANNVGLTVTNSGGVAYGIGVASGGSAVLDSSRNTSTAEKKVTINATSSSEADGIYATGDNGVAAPGRNYSQVGLGTQKAEISATSTGSAAYGIKATEGADVVLYVGGSDASKITVTSKIQEAANGNAASVYANGGGSSIGLNSNTVEINVESNATESSSSNPYPTAAGIQVSDEGSVWVGNLDNSNSDKPVVGSTLKINGTAKNVSTLTGIDVKAASQTSYAENTTIELNVSKDVNEKYSVLDDAKAIATGIAVSNVKTNGTEVGDGSVSVKGSLNVAVGSTKNATGLLVTGKSSATEPSQITVDGDATINAITQGGTAAGIQVSGYATTPTGDSTTYYSSATVKGNVTINATGTLNATEDIPAVIGVVAQGGTVTLGTEGSNSEVTINATGSKASDPYNEEVRKYTTAVVVAPQENNQPAGLFHAYGKTITINSSGDGIMASGDATGPEVNISSLKDGNFIDGSSITINSLDNAINAKGGADVTLASESISISVGDDWSREGIDALVFDKGSHYIYGKTTEITSTGNGIEATGGAEVSVGDATIDGVTTHHTTGSTLEISSNDEALYADTKAHVTFAAENITLRSNSALGTVQVENTGTVDKNNSSNSEEDTKARTSVSVLAKNLTVENDYSSVSTAGDAGATFAAYSNTDLTVSAAQALTVDAANGQGDIVRVYGNAQVRVIGGEGSSLKGNVVFAPHEGLDSSGTTSTKGTEGSVTLVLSGEKSEWEGRSYNDRGFVTSTTLTHGSTGSLLTNYTTFNVGLSDGATWTVTGESFFTHVALEDGGTVDASSESVKQFSGAGKGSEVGLITVKGHKNKLYINDDASINNVHIAMVKDDADTDPEKPELIVDTVTAFDIDDSDATEITQASNRLTFVTNEDSEKGDVTEKGMLTIKDAFSITSTAFNSTAGVVDWNTANEQNEAIDHYNFMQGTLVTQSSTAANVDTQLRLNNIKGDDIKGDGDVNVKAGVRVDMMPYTAEGKTPTEAKTNLRKLNLLGNAEFYAWNNKEVKATEVETGESGKVYIRSNESVENKDNRTATEITTLTLGKSGTFEAINNKSVTITTATVGESAKVSITDVALDAETVTPTTKTEITTLNIQKSGKFEADKNASVKLGTVNVANVDAVPEEAIVKVTGSGEVTVTDLNLGNNAKVSATGNTSVVIDHVKAGSTLTGDTGTGASANIVLQNNTDVTVKNIATGASATVTVTENTNTAQIGDRTGETLAGVISLGSKSTLTAQDASLYATSVTLADGDDSTKTKLEITGDAKDVTDGHYDNVKVAVTDLNLGNYSEVTLANNKEVAITNIKAGSGITGVTDSEGTKAKMEVKGSENVTVDHLNLGEEATFDAKSNVTATVKNIETAASATVTVTENTNTAQIGDRTGETLAGVISLGSKSTLTAQDASLYATSVTLADGDDTTKTKFEITGDAKDATDSHYDNVKVAVTDLKLGNYSEVTLTNNKSVTVGTITGATTGATATGDSATVSVTGSESVSIDSLKLGTKGKFKAESNGEVMIQNITTGEGAKVTVHGAEADTNAVHAILGNVTLGASSTLEATNAVLTGENLSPVNVTVAENAKFTLTSNKASSFINKLDVKGIFTASNATVNVETLKGNGNVNVGVATTSGEGASATTTHTGANMYVKTLSMSGGSIYVDPIFGETSVLTVESLGEENTLNTKITAGPGALVSIGAGSAEAAVAAVKANVEANSNSTNNLANAGSLIYVAQPVTLGENASLMSNPEASAGTTADSKTINVSKGGALIVDQSKVGSQAFTGVTKVNVDESSTLAVINVVAGTSFSLADADTTIDGTITSVTDSPFVVASVNSDHRKVNLTGTATDTGMSVIASMGVQSMLRRADMVLAETVADHSVVTLDSTKGVALWADVRGEQYKQTSLGHGAGFKTNIGYGTVGAEVAPTDSTSLGIAFQYGRGTVKGDLYNVKNKTKNYGATLYGSTMLGATGVKLVGEIAYIKSDNDITNSYYTGLNQDLDAKIFSAGLTVQKNFKLGSFDVTPSLGVRVSKLKTDDMKAGLSTIEDQSQTLVQVPVAVRFSAKTFETASGWGITPKFKLAVVPTFGDKSIEVFDNKRTVIDASPFQGALGVTFTKGNFSVNATANAGAGQRGSKAFGGKVGVNYRF